MYHIIFCDKCKKISVAQTKNYWIDCRTVHCRVCGKTLTIKPFYPKTYKKDITDPKEATYLCQFMKSRREGMIYD